MTPELDFDRPLARRTDPNTSAMADEANRLRRGSQNARILVYLLTYGPATAAEWEAGLGLLHGPRAKGLKDGGLIRATGETRITDEGGCEAEVHELTDAGRHAAEVFQRDVELDRRGATVRVNFPDPSLYDKVRERAKAAGLDVSSYIVARMEAEHGK